MNKKFIIIIFLAFIAISLGVLFSLKAKPVQQTVVPVVRFAARPPAVINVADSPTEVTVSFAGEVPSFPNSLPVYQFTNRVYSNDEVAKVAQSLGFTSLPTRLLYGKETKTTWRSDTSALSFASNGFDQSWSYNLFQSETNVAPTQPLLDGARLFVEKSFFPGETTGLVFQQEMATPIEHVQITEVPKPTLRGYLFIKETPNSYRVVSGQFASSPVSVVIDQYGVVRRVSFVSPPPVLQGQDISVISVDDAIASINKGLGLLVSVTKNGDSYWEKTPQFHSVLLSDVQLVYYPDQKSSLLVPFYLFTGTAKTTENLVVDVVYAVSAIE